MGFFSDLFGGTDRSAQKGQIRANAATQDFIEQQSERARGDLLNLFGQGESATRAGTQGALDVMGQTIPQQFSAIQQGNMGAQGTIASGMRGARAALMGDSYQEPFTPQGINIDTSFAQQQLPPSSFNAQQPSFNAPQTASQGLQGIPPEIIRLLQQRGIL